MRTENLSRRGFMGLTGAVAGAMMLGGYEMGWGKNETKVNTKKLKIKKYQTDVLVVGGGMAGLFSAVKAHDNGAKTMIVSKGRLGSSGLTPFAKGIFSYDEKKEKLSPDEFADKVNRSAQGSSNKAYTKQLAIHSKARVQELKKWGFFDSALYNKSFMNPIEERNIPLHERITITHLVKENGKVIGAAGFSIDEEKVLIYEAKSVILCTGSGGFKSNGFPLCDCTHDGDIMAYEIGAKVMGKEWNDGHPARSKNAAASYDGWGDMFEQKPSTTGVGIRHDLGVDANYMAYKLGSPMTMGRPGENKSVSGGPYTPTEFSRRDERPPQGENDGHRPPPPNKKDGKGAPPGMGGDIVGGSTAGMAIHKSEGLSPINENCESTITGLYAAGDNLASCMSGGIYTQIGGSLSASAVQGAIAGEYAAKYSKKVNLQKISDKKVKKLTSEILAPLKRKAGYSPAWVTQTLQGIMFPNFVLYIKKESMLKGALAFIEELRDHHLPMLRASSLHELRLAHETKNMILTAEMKLKASLMRKESRASHYRLDYPTADEKNWQAWINIYKGKNGEMKLEKQPFGTWSKKS